MPDEKKKRMCPDPDCKTENEGDIAFCSKCGMDMDMFFNLDKALTIREKIADSKRKEEEGKKPKRQSGLASLAGKKRS